ncbi:uncharacterized protein [Epargyreus clarus]|uniref:uncharacterized protein n=1 Tax=Epargyreus clarus TaxID=520877 RepID=UPI003C2C560F
MIAKIAAILALVAAAQAGLYGSSAVGYAGGLGSYGYGSLGYGSHGYGSVGYGSHGYGSGYAIAPYTSYATPIVKTIAPVYTPAYTPAVSSVSQVSIHQAPLVKSYTPIAYSSYTPYVSHAYTPAVSYGSYGGYGYGGYGSKYAW